MDHGYIEAAEKLQSESRISLQVWCFLLDFIRGVWLGILLGSVLLF